MTRCTICGHRAEFDVDMLDAFYQRTGNIQGACSTDLGIVITRMRDTADRSIEPTFIVDTL